MTQINKNLSEQGVKALVCKIARLLNGVPIDQASDVLKETVSFINDGHTVDINHPRFKAKLSEIEEFYVG